MTREEKNAAARAMRERYKEIGCCPCGRRPELGLKHCDRCLQLKKIQKARTRARWAKL